MAIPGWMTGTSEVLGAVGASGLFGGGGSLFGKKGGSSDMAISGGPFTSGPFNVTTQEQYGLLIVAGIVLLFLIARR